MDRKVLKRKCEQAKSKSLSLLDDLGFMYSVYQESGNEAEAHCVAGLIAHYKAGHDLLEDLRNLVI